MLTLTTRQGRTLAVALCTHAAAVPRPPRPPGARGGWLVVVPLGPRPPGTAWLASPPPDSTHTQSGTVRASGGRGRPWQKLAAGQATKDHHPQQKAHHQGGAHNQRDPLAPRSPRSHRLTRGRTALCCGGGGERPPSPVRLTRPSPPPQARCHRGMADRGSSRAAEAGPATNSQRGRGATGDRGGGSRTTKNGERVAHLNNRSGSGSSPQAGHLSEY